ncbi:capsular polysaccharide biosynthesis protein [uncultured Cohaesibacter sp.]|uniref:capsular polysaccharide export protein, LipB/KpsS family n=1 Tax=uncultured Cohaesibacter sp. TaxID=1002546 RepID=UPI0029C72AE9|nr:capsular polysaccharide biosynthesis protein [uncultured Cohaesibacter sp.]
MKIDSLLKDTWISVTNVFKPSTIMGTYPANGIMTHVLGLSTWRGLVPNWFPDKNLCFHSRFMLGSTRRRFIEHLKRHPGDEILVWGYKVHPEILDAAQRNGNPVVFVEDGFIRSVKLGGAITPPLSIVADRQALYFDARSRTDLEDLLNSYDFGEDPDLVERARAVMGTVLGAGISKYNSSSGDIVDFDKIAEGRKKILVVGQVEDDASIRFGCNRQMTNNDLVRIAHEENPDCLIIYKPHPDVLYGYRSQMSDPEEVKDIALILREPWQLSRVFAAVDHVYTMTSLAGFEALMRGLSVTCLGAPFYSGWGLTDDRQLTGRRNRTLTIEQVFAICYILYPRYFDPVKRELISIEEALGLLQRMIESHRQKT